MFRTAALAALVGALCVSSALAGQICFPPGTVGPNMCLAWSSDSNTTTMTLTCDAGASAMGKALNWCGVAMNPTGTKMYPAEAWLLIPNAAGTALVVENRHNSAHAVPACYTTSVATLINSTVSADASGGMVLEASWSRARYLGDSDLIEQGHVNLTGSVAGGALGSLIAAASQAPPTAYAACDPANLEYHSFFSGGLSIDWDK